MRFVCLAILTVVTAASSARADVIVQTLRMSQSGPDGGPFDITGAEFNPQLGTLDSVSATFSGLYRADIFTPNASTSPPSVASHVFGTVIAGTGNGLTNMEFGSIALTLSGSSYVGSASVSLTSPFFFADPDAFLGTNQAARGLLDFDFFSPLGFPDGATSDSSSFTGSLVLDYTYTPIPEPPAALVFLSGAVMLTASSSFLKKRTKKLLSI